MDTKEFLHELSNIYAISPEDEVKLLNLLDEVRTVTTDSTYSVDQLVRIGAVEATIAIMKTRGHALPSARSILEVAKLFETYVNTGKIRDGSVD